MTKVEIIALMAAVLKAGCDTFDSDGVCIKNAQRLYDLAVERDTERQSKEPTE